MSLCYDVRYGTLQSTNVTEILDTVTTDLDGTGGYVPGGNTTHNEQKHGQHLLQSTAMTISGFTTSDDEDDDHVVFVTQVVNKKAATVQYGTVLVVAHSIYAPGSGRAYCIPMQCS